MDRKAEATGTERHGIITLTLEDNERCVQEREKNELRVQGPEEIIP